jgi:hypothetical protein
VLEKLYSYFHRMGFLPPEVGSLPLGYSNASVTAAVQDMPMCAWGSYPKLAVLGRIVRVELKDKLRVIHRKNSCPVCGGALWCTMHQSGGFLGIRIRFRRFFSCFVRKKSSLLKDSAPPALASLG